MMKSKRVKKYKQISTKKQKSFLSLVLVVVVSVPLLLLLNRPVPKLENPPNNEKCGDIKIHSLQEYNFEPGWDNIKKDVHACVLKNVIGWEVGGVNRDYAENSIRKADYIGVIRTETDRICGFFTLHKQYSHTFAYGLSYELHVLCADYKGRGTRLLKEAIEFCRKKNVKILLLETFNLKLVDYYQKHGFKNGWPLKHNVGCDDTLPPQKEGDTFYMYMCLQ